MLQKQELDQINKGWTTVVIVWIALMTSLGIYLVVCKAVEGQIPVSIDAGQFQSLKYALFGISALTLAGAYVLRKFLITKATRLFNPTAFPSGAHPAVAGYLTAIIVVLALAESVGIYGMVLFFIGGDAVSLYQLMILAAAAMIFFRPKKVELIEIAEKMKKIDP
jgi:hypothetical protein